MKELKLEGIRSIIFRGMKRDGFLSHSVCDPSEIFYPLSPVDLFG
jgi:hypothetical protein